MSNSTDEVVPAVSIQPEIPSSPPEFIGNQKTHKSDF